MIFLLKVIAIAIIVYGCLLILKPRILEKIIKYIETDKNFYMVNVAKAVLGVILIIASSSCSIQWIVLFIGALMTFSAISVFFLKKKAINKIIEWAKSIPKKKVYLLGLAALSLGILLILAI